MSYIKLGCVDFFDVSAEALVNAVNTVGVMGTGIALEFKTKYPAMFQEYRAWCLKGKIRIGQMHVYDNMRSFGSQPRWIINFPTKKHWRDKSTLDDIEAGLRDLVNTIERLNIRSIAIPALGCGNSGLDWKDVRPMIEKAMRRVWPETSVKLFEP